VVVERNGARNMFSGLNSGGKIGSASSNGGTQIGGMYSARSINSRSDYGAVNSACFESGATNVKCEI
jgi:hypothetical protein